MNQLLNIAIISMLYESIGLVSANGVFFLYQLIYVKNESFANLLKSFAIQTSILLLIERFFTSVSLAIEIHYQNMAVMAVWQKRWKRHVLVVIVNAVPLALWSSGSIIEILHGRFSGTNHPCKSPFSRECAIVEGCVPFVFERYLPGFDNSKNCTSVSYFLE